MSHARKPPFWWAIPVLGLVLIIMASGCKSVPKPAPPAYPVDFAATIRHRNQIAPHRSFRAIIQPDRWLRVTIGQDAPQSAKQPAKSIQLSEAQMAEAYRLLSALPQTDRPDAGQAEQAQSLTATYFAHNAAAFCRAADWSTNADALAFIRLITDSIGLAPAG